ncbi:hypothetical protein [Enterococcus avium]|uniref:hypothetical protein n=1 Tax=Enterococcus avium TaxID=33945 RepID=UPI00289216B0|nr:hypothetical protein [Enterococcus avium]MDT2485036.1 hypothetical protein [Enterococcus avium]MDT2511622.1 hypothetical protein [Enterococcus avium]
MSIELERSLELRKLHLEKNDPKCEHEYEKEFFNGIPTGDYACKKCGHSISRAAYIKLTKNKH